LIEIGALHFASPDLDRFPCLRLARQAGEEGGTAPVVLNAANEVAVAGLLAQRLPFVQIPAVVEKSLAALPGRRLGSLEEALAVDEEARRVAASFLN
jgi:1-deoxy-D-xylulose-5-phosphate reductoisomerase